MRALTLRLALRMVARAMARTRGLATPRTRCPICTGVGRQCRCDQVQVWLIRTSRHLAQP